MPVWQPQRETYTQSRDSQLLKQNTNGLPVGRQQARQSDQSQQQAFRNSQQESQKDAGNQDVRGEPNEDPSAGADEVPQRKKKKKKKKKKHKKDSSVQETQDEQERSNCRRKDYQGEEAALPKTCTGSVSPTRAAIKVPKKKKSHKRHLSEED
jgi:hypothetical protein